MTKKKVSVIIRTKNEEEGIERCLKGILSQKSDCDIEILIVDSGSSDRTLEIAQKYPVRIITIAPEKFTFGYSLNLGIRKAEGDYVAIISGHSCPVDNLWIQNLKNAITGDGVVASFGKDLNDPLRKSPFDGFLKSFQGNERVTYTDKAPFTNTNSAIIRDIALEFPFNEQVPASEDKIWAEKILKELKNAKIVYEPQAKIYHTDKLSLIEVFRKRKITGEVHFIRNTHKLSYYKMLRGCASGIKYNYKYLFSSRKHSFWWCFLLPFYHLAKAAGYYAGYKKAKRSLSG